MAPEPEPDRSTPAAAGAYLASLGHCMLCHTPMLPDGRLDYQNQLGAGGRKFGPVVAPNITQDRETGIGKWSDAEIKRALTQGLTPEGRLLAAPMPWPYLARLKNEDMEALVAYLRTVPPKRHLVE